VPLANEKSITSFHWLASYLSGTIIGFPLTRLYVTGLSIGYWNLFENQFWFDPARTNVSHPPICSGNFVIPHTTGFGKRGASHWLIEKPLNLPLVYGNTNWLAIGFRNFKLWNTSWLAGKVESADERCLFFPFYFAFECVSPGGSMRGCHSNHWGERTEREKWILSTHREWFWFRISISGGISVIKSTPALEQKYLDEDLLISYLKFEILGDVRCTKYLQWLMIQWLRGGGGERARVLEVEGTGFTSCEPEGKPVDEQDVYLCRHF